MVIFSYCYIMFIYNINDHVMLGTRYEDKSWNKKDKNRTNEKIKVLVIKLITINDCSKFFFRQLSTN